jgi:hypothetical protein
MIFASNCNKANPFLGDVVQLFFDSSIPKRENAPLRAPCDEKDYLIRFSLSKLQHFRAAWSLLLIASTGR